MLTHILKKNLLYRIRIEEIEENAWLNEGKAVLSCDVCLNHVGP